MHPTAAVVTLSGRITVGPEGPGPPERPGAPRETSVLRGFKGACKRPLKLQDDHPLFIDALLQFASVFLYSTEIGVEKQRRIQGGQSGHGPPWGANPAMAPLGGHGRIGHCQIVS